MGERSMPDDNGVIINVYVESRIPRSDRMRRIKPVRLPAQRSAFKTRGYYDRRFQLLAYAQQLRRRADPEQLRNPRRKSEMKRRWSVAAERIRQLFSRMRNGKRQWKYESIGGEDCGRRRNFHFCKKLMCLFKKIAGAWRCKNGGCYC